MRHALSFCYFTVVQLNKVSIATSSVLLMLEDTLSPAHLMAISYQGKLPGVKILAIISPLLWSPRASTPSPSRSGTKLVLATGNLSCMDFYVA